MKKLATIAILTLLFTACAKTSETVDTNILYGKWTYISNGVNLEILPGDYLEIRNDGKAYRRYKSVSDTSFYNVIGDTLKFNKGKYVNGQLKYTDVYLIKGNTSSSLVLFDLNSYWAALQRLTIFVYNYTLSKQ
jgi:hypothetical protein